MKNADAIKKTGKIEERSNEIIDIFSESFFIKILFRIASIFGRS